VAPEVEKRLKAFMVASFVSEPGLLTALAKAVSMGWQWRREYRDLANTTEPSYGKSNDPHAIPLDDDAAFTFEQQQVLKSYLITVARLSRYNAYKKLFGLWRIAHVPVIYLLLFAGLAHVLAVHMY